MGGRIRGGLEHDPSAHSETAAQRRALISVARLRSSFRRKAVRDRARSRASVEQPRPKSEALRDDLCGPQLAAVDTDPHAPGRSAAAVGRFRPDRVRRKRLGKAAGLGRPVGHPGRGCRSGTIGPSPGAAEPPDSVSGDDWLYQPREVQPCRSAAAVQSPGHRHQPDVCHLLRRHHPAVDASTEPGGVDLRTQRRAPLHRPGCKEPHLSNPAQPRALLVGRPRYPEVSGGAPYFPAPVSRIAGNSRGQGLRILFVIDKRINAGSIRAVASYASAADRMGHTIAAYGSPDSSLPKVRFSMETDQFDFVVFILESNLNWLSGLRVARILRTVPHERRVVLDADGLYNDIVSLGDYDRNHASIAERNGWRETCERLGSRIFQPTLTPLDPRIKPLLFYGYAPEEEARPEDPRGKTVDVLHVSHNWWRWKELEELFFPAVGRMRERIGEICFLGLWWDGCPPWAAALGLTEAFRVDRARLKSLRITVRPPVPFTQVISAMSSGKVNIMTQRPLAALETPEHFRGAVQRAREHLRTHHSYRTRVQQLVAALET